MSGNLKIKSPDSQNLEEKSSELVVQCTHCSTKYSVPEENFVDIKEPKFHCFYCDNIFSFEVNKVKSEVKTEVEKEEPVQVVDNDLEDSDQQMHLGFISNLKIKTSNFSSPDSSDENTGSYQEQRLKKKLEKEQEQKEFAEKTSVLSNFSARTFCKNFVFSSDQETKDQEQQKTNKKTFFKKINSEIKIFFNNTKKFLVQSLRSLKESLSMTSQFSVGLVKSPMRLLFLISPILFVLILLSVLTYFIRKSPQDFSPYLKQFSANIPQIAPAGVGVKNLDLEEMTLDNGERIKVLKGEVYNNSSLTVTNPRIEGALFDPSGDLIHRSLVQLSEQMEGMKIKSLSSEVLKNLHISYDHDSMIIKPNEEKEFVLAFWQKLDKSPSYFSSRVYSVS